MLGLGFGEILIVALIALLFLGPKKLPQAARTLARFINEVKNSLLSSELKEIKEIKEELESFPEPKGTKLDDRSE